jgi:DNA-binding NarL/FixJ family response regulator
MNIVDEAGDGREAFASVLTHSPDIAVLDAFMPRYTGKEILEEIRRRDLQTRVLLTTSRDDPEYLAPAFWSDALGYFYKGDGIEDWIVPALKALSLGRHFVSPTPLAALRNHYAAFSLQPRRLSLTGIEEEMLRLTVRGMSDKEMASALALPVRTVEKRKARLRRKVGVNSTVELAVYAVTQRLFDASSGRPVATEGPG